MPKLGKGTIVFDQDDWLAGMNPAYLTGLTDVPAPQVGGGLAEAIRFNPFRYLGYASPGFDPTDVTNVSVVSDALRNVAVSYQNSTNFAYFCGYDNKLQKLNIDTKTLTSPAWHTTTGVTTVTHSDIISYTSNITSVATPCVYYSWNDSGGNWNIGRYRTDTDAFTDAFIAAATFSSTGNNKPHPMIVGADDVLYIGDGNVLQAYDGGSGANGTSSAALLTLPQGYIITSFARISQPTPFLVIFAYYSAQGNTTTVNTNSSGRAQAFFYDYLSLDPTFVIDLNDNTVTAAFAWKGTIGCFTQGFNLANDGSNRFCRLKIWNGSIFETAVEFIGNAPIHGGVDIVGDSIQWNSSNGSVCTISSYGSPFSGVKAGLNILGAGLGNTPGVLRTLSSSATIAGYQVISSGVTTSGGLQYMKVATYAGSASVRSVTVAPEFNRGMMGKVRGVRVDFAKTSVSTGAPIDVYLVYENSQSSQVIASTALVDSTNLTKWYYFDQAGAFLPSFFEMSCLLRWTAGAVDTDAPIVRRVVVDYEETNVQQ